jgi:hypothetical protein
VPDSGVELATDVVAAPPAGRLAPATFVMHIRSSRVNPLEMGDPALSGITQTFDQAGIHTRALASAWVFVVRGPVGMGTGTAGLTKPTVRNTNVGQWEQLVALNDTDPATQFVLFGLDQRGSEFYVADPVVCPAARDSDLAACRQAVGLDVHPRRCPFPQNSSPYCFWRQSTSQ